MKKYIVLLLITAFGLFAQTWDGSESDDWNDGANWSTGVKPTSSSTVIITTVGTNYPTLSADAVCRKLTIQPGATLNGGTGTLSISSASTSAGNFINNGTFNCDESTIILLPAGGTTTRQIALTGIRELYNLTIQPPTSAAGLVKVTDTGNITILNDFNFNGGNFNLNNNNLIVGNNFISDTEISGFSTTYTSFGTITMTGSNALLQGPLAVTAGQPYITAEIVINSADSINIYNADLYASKITVQSGKLTSFYDFGEDGSVWYNVELGSPNIDGGLTVNSGATVLFGESAVKIYSGDAVINGTVNIHSVGSFDVSQDLGGSITGNNSGAKLYANGSTITVAKDFSFAGTFYKGTSTVIFNSANDSYIADNTQFYNLTFNKGSNSNIIRPVTLDNIVSFTNSLTWTNGYFYRGGLQAVKTGITTLDINKFCGLTLAAAGNVTVTKYTSSTPPGGPNAIRNFLVISNASQNVTSVKSYYQSGGTYDELNTGFNNQAGNLRAWRSTNAGSNWNKVGTSDEDNGSSVAYTAAPAATAGQTTYFAFMDNTSSSLPVEFDSTYFYASRQNEGIELTWLTHSEENLKGFVVYRSTSQTDGFTEIDSWISNENLRSTNNGYSTHDTYYAYIDRNFEPGTKYYYRLKAYCSENDQSFHPKTAVYEPEETSGLAQNYPNPFNSQTTIRYTVGKELPVSLVIYNSTGQTVKELVNSIQKRGVYTTSISTSDMASGMYYYRLKVGNQTFIKKMMAVK